MDCGPTCLQMISKFYGRFFLLDNLRDKCRIDREGVSLYGISDAAESLGFHTLPATIPFENLINDAPLPLIAHWHQNHFVVVFKISKNAVHIADPMHGIIALDMASFKKNWMSTKVNDKDSGVVLFIEPTPLFYKQKGEKRDNRSLKSFMAYLRPYRNFFIQLYIGILISSLIALIFPFLSQSLIDVGINERNISFIYLILLSQLVLNITSTIVEFIRGWIFLHMGTRISISIISDFLIKLLKLPFSFFDNKTIGDLLQRISDHHRVQSFLTSSALTVIFSIIDFFIFGILLIIYNFKIFLLFAITSMLYFGWNAIFLKKRKALDYKSFDQAALAQNSLLQLLNGIQEVKLQNCEKKKRWEWERVQAQQYKISIEGLSLSQYQQAGAIFIDRIKNLGISYLAAKSVIAGDMSLGMMLSISYIVGQLNGPISQFVSLVYAYQDAKISLDRLNEIHDKGEEDDFEDQISVLPNDKSIVLKNISFSYTGLSEDNVLKDINLTVPAGKKTAIVGLSGSGKSTLLKLMLKVYEPTWGEIMVGDTPIKSVKNSFWRGECGIVSQEGFLFSDTIANNISISDERVDKEKLRRAVTISNIKEFIEGLPLKYNTKVGQDGNGISQGQKQRLLIARAVYKNPQYIFFDEATNSLDAHNESEILKQLDNFLDGKTVVSVAHRLSTVKNADQIIVLKEGKIIESGNHETLISLQGEYFRLVKEQLNI